MSRRILSVLSFVATLALVTAPGLASAAKSDSLPGVPDIPVPTNMGFGGFFRHHQPVKIVFAVGQPGVQATESLINAALVIKYLESKGYKYKIHFVFYGKGDLIADQLSQKYSAGWAPLLEALHRKGVTFSVCHNAMVLLHLKSSEIYPFVTIAPAGILSVVQYEDMGYMPIFNPNSVTGASIVPSK